MKVVIAAWLNCLLISFLVTGSGFAKVDERDIAGIWLFEEGQADTAKDASKNKNDGKLIKGPKWVNGKFGKALAFDGKDDYVQIAPFFGKDVSELTVMAWLKINNWNNLGGGIDFTGKREMYMGVGTSGGKSIDWRFYTKFVGETEAFYSDKDWHHLAGVFDNGTQKLYKDGSLVQTAASNEKSFDLTGVGINIGFNQVKNGYFDGIIDEVAIFNVSLADADITSLGKNGLKKATAVSPRGKLTTAWGWIKK